LFEIKELDGGVVFVVKVVPGSSKTAIVGVLGEMAKVKVAAVPEKGKANKELVGFMSKLFGVCKSDVSVISGETSKVKRIRVFGVSSEHVCKCLGF
jgi:uncharacterized protein (TIGR00251 family)